MSKKYYLKNGKFVTRKELIAVLDWCKKKLGRSKYFSIREIRIRFKTDLTYFLGEFDTERNCIYINPNANKNLMDFIATIIHEYVHFLQDPDKYDEIEMRLPRSSRYYDHPYEDQAENTAQKYKKKCYKDLKETIGW